MLPGAIGANRKPALLLRFRQGASQPPLFQQTYPFTRLERSFLPESAYLHPKSPFVTPSLAFIERLTFNVGIARNLIFHDPSKIDFFLRSHANDPATAAPK
jgi:hypothetical protein